MKDKYAEIIQLKKDSLQASRDESDYQDSVADQIKEIAELQAQINRLSLDDSRSAQAQKAQLEEQLAELQKQLSDDQADYAYESQVDSLDKMQEAYEDQKDKEIEALQDSISSTQKIYDMAIDYIENHWDTLYNDLVSWNYEYGSSLESELTSAWNAALDAAKQYGSYIDALNAMGGSSGNSSNGSGNSNIVGGIEDGGGYTDEDAIKAIVSQMKRNANAWHNASSSEQKKLDAENARLGAQLAQYGVTAYRDERSGVWYTSGGRRLFDVYHAGGIVGTDGNLKQKEMMAILEKGEAVLD